MIKKPTELDYTNDHVIMIIAGMPGTGKTTLALSAPNVLLIDADHGLKRVKPEHRKDSSDSATYKEILEDIKSAEGVYDTIAIDTTGALIELMKEWAMDTDPSARKASGGISQKGYGVIKEEFIRLSADLKRKFNVIYIFHAKKSQGDEDIFYDIICEGSAKEIVYQPADLAAFLHIVNGERYLGFTPTSRYNAKSAYGIRGLIKVPELDNGDKNEFLTTLFAQVRDNLRKEKEAFSGESAVYEKALADGKKIIDEMTVPDKAIAALNDIRALKHALTSLKELEAIYKAKIKNEGWKYNAFAKQYEYATASK